LPFGTETFSGATVGFGVRNLADLDRGLSELHRVLRIDARLVVLEFTTPPNPLLRQLYLFYFHQVLPRVGRWVSGHPWAYSYLPASVKEFPGPAQLAGRMRRAGFRDASWSLLSGGIAALHVATK
ncbi:MAG TPA: demethylmenaquinone methyltransferase, partial [Gemmatimonadetes bacterium]|nr:demethylmenaquinone methyltransferase [Gemmatimonadota bacterium]